MKRLHSNDIKYDGKTIYYSVCCGSITKIVFIKKINKKWSLIKFLPSNLITKEIFSNIGIDNDAKGKCHNDLSCTFETAHDAEAFISSPKYIEKLKRHRANDDYWGPIIDIS